MVLVELQTELCEGCDAEVSVCYVMAGCSVPDVGGAEKGH